MAISSIYFEKLRRDFPCEFRRENKPRFGVGGLGVSVPPFDEAFTPALDKHLPGQAG